MLTENNVCIIQNTSIIDYEEKSFFPDASYSESANLNENKINKNNKVYGQVREVFRSLALDANNFGTPEWNPFCELIKPGDKVVLKPNFVRESKTKKINSNCIITHGSVIKAVLDYVVIALKNKGEVYIVDSPQSDADFDKILKETRLEEIIENYKNKTDVKIYCYDLRNIRDVYKNGVIIEKIKLNGDKKGVIEVDLGNISSFYGKKNQNYYGADYDTSEVKKYHHGNINKYVISKTVLDSDVIINIPKLKTHKLNGVTLCMKNAVGIVINKNSLPHHTITTNKSIGDDFPVKTKKGDLENLLKNKAFNILKFKNKYINYIASLIKKILRGYFGNNAKTIRNGSWYGNDTICRTVNDLNKILLYCDKDGYMQETQQRKFFGLVDGIVGGEGNGPLEPEPRKSGILVAGYNPLIIDIVCSTVMGYDYTKIPFITKALESKEYSITNLKADKINIISNNRSWCKQIGLIPYSDTLMYKPHYGWKGNIELEN